MKFSQESQLNKTTLLLKVPLKLDGIYIDLFIYSLMYMAFLLTSQIHTKPLLIRQNQPWPWRYCQTSPIFLFIEIHCYLENVN